MPTYLTPGVYVEEIPSGVKPIEGVATSVAAFVGPARRGPAGEAHLVHSFGDYVATYGSIHSLGDEMGLAVAAFYLNGGKDAYIARLVSSSPPANASFLIVKNEPTATVPAGSDVLNISANSVGSWGDEVQIQIKKTNPSDLTFALEVGHLEDDKMVADEIFTNLDMNATSPDYVVTRVNGQSAFVRVSLESGAPSLYQRGSLTGESMSSASDAFNDTTGISDYMTMTLNIDGLGAKRIKLDDKISLGFEGDDNAVDGNALADAVVAAVVKLGASQEPYGNFSCVYDTAGANPKFVLESGSTSSSSSVVVYGGDGTETDLAQFMKLDPSANPVSVHGSANVIPQAVPGDLGEGKPLHDGEEGPPAASDYQNFFETKLSKVRDVSILVLPGQTVPKSGAGNPAIDAAIAHCEATRSRVVIIDPEPGFELTDATKVDQLGLTTSTYAVLYYPWVKTHNPFYNRDTNPTAHTTVTIAPSAFAAGMWSRIDGRRGVWKAPAGMETSLLGVAALEFDVGDGEQSQLNPLAVNALRKPPAGGGSGVMWGSRTLSTKADPEWRYVPVRRTAIFIEQSIYNGIQWAVFEPNDHRLWASLRLNMEAFMDGLFRSGAFQGEKASDGYFVRCGLGDTMTQDDIDRGQVIAIVGFAPLKPAEFVIVRIQQKVAQQ